MGNTLEAKKRYEEALSIWRSTGNKAGEQTALANLANLLNDQGDLTGARKMQQDALAISREIGENSDVALTLVDIGDVQISLGDPAGAIANDREAVELTRQLGDRWTLAAALAHISRAFYLSGDLRSAKQSVQESLDITRQTNDKHYAAETMAIWGQILMAEGDLLQARQNLQQALQIRTAIEEKSDAAESRLELAALSIEEGHAADAEQVARKVRDEYRREGHPDDEIGADTVLLRALLAENKSDEAERELDAAKSLVAKSQNVRNRLAIGIVGAQIQAVSGKHNEALLSLSTAIRDATRSGLLPDQFEARLAHADIELKSGKTVAGRAELVALKKDSTGKGFRLIAEKATALITKGQHGS